MLYKNNSEEQTKTIVKGRDEIMAEIVEHIPELKGIDAEIFLENLEREITEEEIKAVRAWALGTKTMTEKEELNDDVIQSQTAIEKLNKAIGACDTLGLTLVNMKRHLIDILMEEVAYREKLKDTKQLIDIE